jgi:hypothetical protein
MKYDRIALYLPTYKRVKRLKRFINSAIEKADDPSRIDFCFIVNALDNETKEFIGLFSFPSGSKSDILTENTKQPNLAFYYNLAYDNFRFNSPSTVVSMVGDDMVFTTHGWDTYILCEVNKANGDIVLHTDDEYIAHGKMCVQLFTTCKVVDATKKPFMCTEFHADMIDVVWYIVAQLTSIRVYLSDVAIRHEHETREIDPLKRDETHRRLAPIQKLTNSKENQKYAIAYGTVIASNLIEDGIGKWNILSPTPVSAERIAA